MEAKNLIISKEAPSASNAFQYAKSDLLPPLLLEYETFVAALQDQVDFYKEKDSAVEMWHMALREVENLEEGLKSYQDNRHVDLAQKKIEDMKQDFSNAITMLEFKLATARSSLAKEKETQEEIQKRLDESLQENSTLTLTLKSRQQELEQALQGQCATAIKLQEIEKKAVEFQEQVESIKKSETDLELALARCHEQRAELLQKNLDAREKVSESLHLVECAVAEKNAALFSEAQTKDENVQLQKMMASIVDEAGARVKEEVEYIKQQYNKKLEVLLHDMKKLDDENNENKKILQKEIQEKHALERELEKMQVESPLATSILEKKLAMAYDELSGLKRRNLQLGIEKENLHSEIERMQESHALDTRKMNIECHLMEEQILGLQARLEAENHAKSKTGGHVEKLVERAHFLEQELERRQGLPDWQQQQYGQEHEKQIQEIQKQSSATASELEHHLERQQLMKTKYHKEIKTMTEKFQMRLQELHSESNALRKENKVLKSHLRTLQQEAAAHKSSVNIFKSSGSDKKTAIITGRTKLAEGMSPHGCSRSSSETM
ncbi:cingulin-like isoform X2 [Zootermopsis nevadensis]|uniref:cingulin-like isoform X2 n=1 Tax=Zootermopsis nevadensis TaxID=136037 RepID=UPI000B8ED9A9|nr:cingulin-like isoform X2 [Zootermopsis nevadensis]